MVAVAEVRAHASSSSSPASASASASSQLFGDRALACTRIPRRALACGPEEVSACASLSDVSSPPA